MRLSRSWGISAFQRFLRQQRRASTIRRCDGEYIVRRQRSPYPLERKLPDRLDGNGILDCHQHTRTDEYLTGPCFVAKARGDVGYRPDGGVVEAPLEADGAESCEAVRYADAEANVVP